MSPWSTSDIRPSYLPYSPVRQSSGDDVMPGRHHRTDSGSSTNTDLESGYAKEGMLSTVKSYAGHYAGRARRQRRPLLVVSAFGAVVCFSLLILGSFSVYSNYLPSRVSLSFGDVDPISDNGEASDDVGVNDETFDLSNGIIPLRDDPTHIVLPVREPHPRPSPLLTPYEPRPPLDMLTEFFMTGLIKNADPATHVQSQMDLVYMYVNSSSDYFLAGKAAKMAEEGLADNAKGHGKHFRDNGELRGSMRSGALAFGERIRNIHLITGAFDIPDESKPKIVPSDDELARLGVNTSDVTGWKVGQIPDWLDYENRGNVKYHVHPDIYHLPRDDDGRLPPSIADEDEVVWRAKALPTFNSFEIETRVGWVDGLSDNFIFSNDDMFFLGGLSTSDFHHPIMGTVIRLEPEMGVKPEVTPNLLSTGGEWGGLQHAGLLIAERFPYRKREYLHHMPKAFTKHVAHEASIMFAPQMTLASTRAFRESKRGRADIENAWVMSHLQIERWREGLLWTYIVAKLGGQDGMLGADARDAFRKALRVPKGNEGDGLIIEKIKRSTLQDMEDISYRAGWEEPFHAQYYFSSFDGHLPGTKAVLHNGAAKRCVFTINQCLPKDFFANDELHKAADVFRSLAYEKPGCGDCLIDALINQSGPRGMSAFFPTADALYFPPKDQPKGMWERAEPILPLTPTWEEADFSIEANVRTGQDAWKGATTRKDGAVHLREWCVKLLSRYSYIYGRTHARFFMVHNPTEFTKYTKELEEHDEVVLTCINDDQPDVTNGAVRQRFQAWMERLFGGDSRFVRYERPNLRWGDDDEYNPDPPEKKE